jgi:glutathione S-transferase
VLTLCGFAASNYYNKVKLALLEKGVPFEEELTWASQEEAFLVHSPRGKVPFVRTSEGSIAESTVILEYIEDVYSEVPLYPQDAYARAKNRELIAFLELHLELVVRRLYPEVFFGGKVSDETKQEVERGLSKGVKAFARLAKFAPFVAGTSFTMADCAAVVHLPIITIASKAILGRDFLEPISAVKPYLKLMAERPHVQRVNADRKVNAELLMARMMTPAGDIMRRGV